MATALITGGTSGIGAAFARALAARGDDLILVARSVERLESTAAELRGLGTGSRIEILSADLSNRADVERVAARLEDPERPVDLLVNNAGFGIHARLTSKDVTEHDRGFEVMCRAVLVLSGAAARSMRPRHAGTIVNVSSTAGYITMGSYSAMKAWVTSFTESLSVELHGTGIQVTALCPGWVRTEFHQRAGIRASSIPGPMWLDADELVAACLRDVARGRVLSVPTARYRAVIWMLRHAPRGLVRAVSGRISSSRDEAQV
jgi:short-subunit dehydrogenase